ncbi:uncharacterized protein LOC105847515 [Hydra vulgaris]|uniref:uncharacterized protein LOC105847515 n=1 Tax=Hydra vulgaris TaxID=6087 RepID=UPI001F5EC549|nr:uncharacterized protein LOC105847515 [Hydra vulgaris]
MRDNNIQKRYICTNPTSVYRKVYCFFGVKTKCRLNGKRFYGLDSKGFKFRLSLSGYEDCRKQYQSLISNVSSPTNTRLCSWLGVVSYGTPINCDSLFYIKTIGSVKCRIQPGYEAQRLLRLNDVNVVITMKIDKSDDGPVYRIIVSDLLIDCKSLHSSSVVKDAFRKLKYISSKNWSGFQFFGLDRSEVINKISCPIIKFDTPSFDNIKQNNNSVIVDLLNIRKCGAEKTSSLLSKKAIKSRNKTIHSLVELASYGDVKSFVSYIINECPEIVEEVIDENTDFLVHIVERLRFITSVKNLDCQQTASIMMDKIEISQRSYKVLKGILKKNNINIPTYDNLRKYCLNIDVGLIQHAHVVV